jgi:hypothetical protein
VLNLDKPIDVVPYAPEGEKHGQELFLNWLQHDFRNRNTERPEKK